MDMEKNDSANPADNSDNHIDHNNYAVNEPAEAQASEPADHARESADVTPPPEPVEPPMPSDEAEIDFTVKYSDESYDAFIENFKQNKKRRLLYRFVKRSFDILVSLFFLLLFSPVMLVIAIAIKMDSRGPIIFRQERVGRNGKPFYCYKFRSMRVSTPHDMPTSQMARPERYVTRVGWVLRKLSLDELPQLICCLNGRMSFIGPRPLVLTEENCHHMRTRLGVYRMRPGISGYAQVNGRDDVYYKNKAIMDALYVRDASLWFDFKLLLQTVLVVIKRKGNNTGKRRKKNRKAKKKS